MPERMTWDEIKKQFQDERVVLTDHHVEGIEIVDGVAVYHGKGKSAVNRRLRELPSGCAVLYTGEIRHGLFGLHAIDLADES